MRYLIRFALGKWELEGRSCFTDNNQAKNISLKAELMNEAEKADQVLSDSIKRKVFMKSNPYYFCYRKSTNKHPKSLFFGGIFTKAQLDEWVAFTGE